MFENDVILYGIQTMKNKAFCSTWFENDVILYGIQTLNFLNPCPGRV